jgi:hypothetical protein
MLFSPLCFHSSFEGAGFLQPDIEKPMSATSVAQNQHIEESCRGSIESSHRKELPCLQKPAWHESQQISRPPLNGTIDRFPADGGVTSETSP